MSGFGALSSGFKDRLCMLAYFETGFASITSSAMIEDFYFLAVQFSIEFSIQCFELCDWSRVGLPPMYLALARNELGFGPITVGSPSLGIDPILGSIYSLPRREVYCATLSSFT